MCSSLLFLAWVCPEFNIAMGILVVTQLALLIGGVQHKHLTAAWAFLFMSFLFFGIRPLHIIIDKDLDLFAVPFLISPTEDLLRDALLWATAASIAFVCGVKWLHRFSRPVPWPTELLDTASEEASSSKNSRKPIMVALGAQILALGAMAAMSGTGTNIYESGLGAFAWEFPQVLQGVQVFGVAFAIYRLTRKKGRGELVHLIAAFGMLLITAWLARNVTIFRGAYIVGLIAAGLGWAMRNNSRVNVAWLVVPIVVVMPVFKILGQTRTSDNAVISSVLVERMEEVVSLQAYWDFFDHSGDINIYDTFVAAYNHEPKVYPYIMSWVYVPLHIVPRTWWSGKPERGVTQDLDYTNGAPYSPGIAGFFLGDGGRIWMLASMFVLGSVIAWGDLIVARMRHGYFKMCLYGLMVVNAMLLSRVFLWQYAYGLLYMLVPCMILDWLVRRVSRSAA